MGNLFDIEQRLEEKSNKVMNPDQFEQVVKAIVDGKYSWACVLILRFAGYNPAHYIPYRTYKRLVQSDRSGQPASPASTTAPQPLQPPSLSAS